MLRNRREAGRFLGELLASRPLQNPLVLGIPRGGVLIAAAIAKEIGGEVDVVLARKLRAPDQPELAIGAVDEEGNALLLPFGKKLLDEERGYVAGEIAFQRHELELRRSLFRAIKPVSSIMGRSVIVTDDGIATGSTMMAALYALRGKRAHEVIVAVPVAAPDSLAKLRGECNDVFCLSAPRYFRAISSFYQDFSEVTDQEVCDLLRPSHRVAEPAAIAEPSAL